MNLTDKRVLLTGGAGFIGSHLAERLLADGNEVVVDRLRRTTTADAGRLRSPGTDQCLRCE